MNLKRDWRERQKGMDHKEYYLAATRAERTDPSQRACQPFEYQLQSMEVPSQLIQCLRRQIVLVERIYKELSSLNPGRPCKNPSGKLVEGYQKESIFVVFPRHIPKGPSRSTRSIFDNTLTCGSSNESIVESDKRTAEIYFAASLQ